MNIDMVQDLVKIKKSLVSVTDKTDLPKLVAGLFEINPKIGIISSGGTAKMIREAGYKVTEVSEYTRYAESPNGLLKTLHPKVHGGILLDPEDKEEGTYMKRHRMKRFDLVVVNLYPFEEIVNEGGNMEEARENIDIGGPTMIRAAAKDFLRVTVVVDPNDYESLMDEMRRNNGCTTLSTRFELARKAFDRTSAYDTAIKEYLHRLEPSHVTGFYLD
jgi:phosphoribosylaminoimidazolecarboxamide formyltransferase/IMP cyclohydrolase